MDAEELYYEDIFQTAHVLNTAIEYCAKKEFSLFSV